LRKLFLFLFLLVNVSVAFAQIEALKYDLIFNDTTKMYDFYIVITKGASVSMRDRVQFGSQISFVLPTESKIEVAKLYMPLADNQNYTGTKPTKWSVSAVIKAPTNDKKHDYYAVGCAMLPASFYNDMKEGDKIRLFSILHTPKKKKNLKKMRLFDNKTDPNSSTEGMQGSDFSQSFSLGRPYSCYVGNVK
jgi:hypothetical protein